MNYENKHPILQKLEDYFKNTPKEQIDKDWSNILKETDPESYYERKYKKALEWMQSLYSGLHGATKEDAEHYFPELKESKDERIRKAIIAYISHDQHCGVSNADMIAWLEKQKEKDLCINCINDKGCITCENGNMKKTKATSKIKTLDADKVIAWLVANICDFEYYVKLFKKDFGL